MNLTTLILQILLTIPLTIILNYVQYKEDKRINQIIIPTIYIILVSALIPAVKYNVFLIVVFEIFIRNFYVTSIVNQKNKISNSMFIIESIISIAISLFTYNYFISNVNTVIPSPEEIKPFLWFIIIVYIIYLYSDVTKNKVIVKKEKAKNLKQEQIIMQYAKFKNIYSSSIRTKSNTVLNLLYALMIYYDNKVPKLYRNIKEYISTITQKETEKGIMQVKSATRISDVESILLKQIEIEKILKNTNIKEMDQVNKVLDTYEDKEEIIAIYNVISEFNKK